MPSSRKAMATLAAGVAHLCDKCKLGDVLQQRAQQPKFLESFTTARTSDILGMDMK